MGDTLLAAVILIAGLSFTAGTLGLAFFTYKSNTHRDSILIGQQAQQLLEKANKEVVDQLQVRVTNLENENRDLRGKIDRCQEEKADMREENRDLLRVNYELQNRILGITEDIRKGGAQRVRPFGRPTDSRRGASTAEPHNNETTKPNSMEDYES